MIERKKISVLDHGFVELVDVMGDDAAIVEAARLSVSGLGIKRLTEDTALLRYLLRLRHTGPFEMVEFKFSMKMPIFVARQFIRHRTANVNELSGRYSELPEEFYVPDLHDIGFQAKKNKQGRAEGVPAFIASTMASFFRREAERAFAFYHQLLGKKPTPASKDEHYGSAFFTEDGIGELAEGGGVARELARINLPLSTYTQWYWKCDLHNIFNFLRLRLDPHAQKEIRVYAEAMADLIKPVVPVAYEAFEDYVLGAVTLSKQDILALQRMIKRYGEGDFLLNGPGPCGEHKTAREATEFMEKMERIFNAQAPSGE